MISLSNSKKVLVKILIMISCIFVACTSIPENTFQLNAKTKVIVDIESWQEQDDDLQDIIIGLKRNILDSYNKIVTIMGVIPEMTDLTVYYNQNPNSKGYLEIVKQDSNVRNILVEDIADPFAEIEVIYQITELPNKLYLSDYADIITIAHEMVHYLSGKHNLISDAWDEGFAEAISRLIYTNEYNDEIDTIIPDYPGLFDLPWNYQWGVDYVEEVQKTFKQNFPLRRPIWSQIWYNYFDNNPDFLKNFYSKLFEVVNPAFSEADLVKIAEESQVGFQDWYKKQIPFQSSLEGTYHHVYKKNETLNLFYFKREIKRWAFVDSITNKIIFEEFLLLEEPAFDTVTVELLRNNIRYPFPRYVDTFTATINRLEPGDIITIYLPEKKVLGPFNWDEMKIIKD